MQTVLYDTTIKKDILAYIEKIYFEDFPYLHVFCGK